MLWLFAQNWLLLSVSFLAGAVLTWLCLLRPGRRVLAANAAVSPAGGAVPDPRYPGCARPLPCGSAPSAEFTVKGDADSMLYHAPASPAYRQVAAEVWFRTEVQAQDAGFRPWDWPARTAQLVPPAFEEGRYPGSAKPDRGGAAPTGEFVVKGSEAAMEYHTTESPFYDMIVAEVWFRGEADAERAGFATWRIGTRPRAAR